MADAQTKAWITRIGRRTASKMPKLCSLPQNVKKDYCQCTVWRRALQDPPNPVHTECSWLEDEETRSLQPVTVPPLIQQAPDRILTLVCCSCESLIPCHSKGCVAAHLPCSPSALHNISTVSREFSLLQQTNCKSRRSR